MTITGLELVEIGRIVRLQIQTSSLKCGSGRDTYYDPEAIAEVDVLAMAVDGATATLGGVETIDVHNNLHAHSKQREGINPLSLGFTSHYAKMRGRFGTRLTDGIAGENMLVETDVEMLLDDVSQGFVIETGDGQRIVLSNVSVAHPCVEFSRFALDDRAADPRVVSEVLKFLDRGVRGFFASVEAGDPCTVRVGDRVLRIAG